MHNANTAAPAQPTVSGLTTITSATLTPEDEGLIIRKALRCLHVLDVTALWVHLLIAHVLGKKLIEKDIFSEDDPQTNIKPWLANGVARLLTIFAVDEDLDFIFREHKFDAAGFRTLGTKELMKPIESWESQGYGSDAFRPEEYGFGAYSGIEAELTPDRRKRVLDTLTKAGLLDRKPNINPTTLVIRLRGDRIVAALKEISPLHYSYLNY
jgi:hypothetical protein